MIEKPKKLIDKVNSVSGSFVQKDENGIDGNDVIDEIESDFMESDFMELCDSIIREDPEYCIPEKELTWQQMEEYEEQKREAVEKEFNYNQIEIALDNAEELKNLYEQEKAAHKTTQQELHDQITERKAQLGKKNNEIKKLAEKYEKQKSEKTKLASELSDKEKQRNGLEKKVGIHKQEGISLKQKVKTMEGHQSVLQSIIDKQTDTINSQKLLIKEH